MEISQQFLIDMALNIGGYILAGTLGIVIYSLFNRRKTVAAVTDREPVESIADHTVAIADTERAARKLEFIKLGEKTTTAPRASLRPEHQETDSMSQRRDRADIIRVARTMLKAGAPHDKIKRVIPISDAELSLLTMSKN